MAIPILFLLVLSLAYANGANDNFKGVATLFGSGVANYRGAIAWATVTTLLGSLAAMFLAGQLLENFSGRGSVDSCLAASPRYIEAVALGAALTVLSATKIGVPVSTTHSLVGALVGAGWAAGSVLRLERLGTDFFLPLLVSPLAAIAAIAVCYPVLHAARQWLGITENTCLCLGKQVVEVAPTVGSVALVQRMEQLRATLGESVVCRTGYHGRVLGVDASATLDWLHYVSAGAVSFARGFNDTPKIAALLLVAPQLGNLGGTLAVAMGMAVGGLVSARNVAEVMSSKITPMNHGQGFTANLVTSAIVIGASRFGLPVSTTHVSCGTLFGIGAVTRQARTRMIAAIFTAWVTTLPAAVILSATSYSALGLL